MSQPVAQPRGFTNDEVKRMAIYIAQLTREGIAYTVAETSDGWVITATGF